jgi:hypothetical protein
MYFLKWKIIFCSHLVKISIYNAYIICFKLVVYDCDYTLQTHCKEHRLGITCKL